MDNEQIEDAALARKVYRSLRKLIEYHYRVKPTEEDLETLKSIHHKLLKLDPQYYFLKRDIANLQELPPGVFI